MKLHVKDLLWAQCKHQYGHQKIFFVQTNKAMMCAYAETDSFVLKVEEKDLVYSWCAHKCFAKTFMCAELLPFYTVWAIKGKGLFSVDV